MPTCVECGQAVSELLREFGPSNIILTKCDHCGQFADRYIEYDMVMILLDMVLHRPRVYRHLLFNRISYRDSGYDANILKFGFIWILFDIYMRFIFLEKNSGVSQSFPDMEMLVALAKIFGSCVLELIVFHLGVMTAVRFYVKEQYAIIKYNYVSMALVLSSFGKSIVVPMVIWDYNDMEYAWFVNVFVITSNAEALSVFLDVPYWKAFLMVLFGVGVKVVLQMILHLIDPLSPIWWLL